MIGRYVKPTPSLFRNRSLTRSLNETGLLISTSKTVVTWGDVLLLATIRSAMVFLITLRGIFSADMTGAAFTFLFSIKSLLSIKSNTSFFVTLPPSPVPITSSRFILYSSASLLTKGEYLSFSSVVTWGAGAGFSSLGPTVGGGAAATVAPPSSSIMAITVPTGSVSPFVWRIFFILPAAGDGISVSTLSVLISTID